MAEHNDLGKFGEELAVDFLEKNGYEILETNWTFDKAEIDIIAQKENILAVSKVLQKVEILCGDYEETLNLADKSTLFYFDPPYKPLSETSSFNSYAKDEFNDGEQIRLRDFCHKLDVLNHSWILSNSDVKGKDLKDNFFDELYSNFYIQRVDARRSINANPEKRGSLKELLINNYSNNINTIERAYGK